MFYEMKTNNVHWQDIVLGAINGLLFGAIAEFVRRIAKEYERDYDRQETARILAETGMSISTTEMVIIYWYALPLFFMIIFVIGSYLTHKFIFTNSTSIILKWQIIGCVSIAGVLIPMANADLLTVGSFTSGFQKTTIALLLIAICLNFFYAVSLTLIKEYLHRKNKFGLP